MPAYFVGTIEITDPEGLSRYRELVPAILARYGARVVLSGRVVETLEGDLNPDGAIVIEFDDEATARAFYDSEEYRKIRPLRLASGRNTMLLVSA